MFIGVPNFEANSYAFPWFSFVYIHFEVKHVSPHYKNLSFFQEASENIAGSG